MLARRALTLAAVRADVPVRMAQKSVDRVQWLALAAGMVLLVAAVPSAMIADDAGGPRRLAGAAGIAILLLWAGSHALVLYRATARAALPRSVGRTPVENAPARGYAAATFALALALPIGALGEARPHRFDDLGEVAGHRPLLAAADLDLVAVAEDDRAEPVPLGLVELPRGDPL